MGKQEELSLHKVFHRNKQNIKILEEWLGKNSFMVCYMG